MMKKKQPLEEEAGTLLQPGYLSKVEEEEAGEVAVVEEKERQKVAALPPEAELSRPRNGLQTLQQQQQQHRGCKRRNSLNSGFKHPGFKRRRRAASDCDPVLPSNFLLGGNIFDPLNLNSLMDEEVNRALNAETPKSSPLPCRNRDPVEILVPRDITDPLSLNRESEVLPSPLKVGGRKRRHRHCHHPAAEDGAAGAGAATTATTTAAATATTTTATTAATTAVAAAAATTTAAAAAGTEPEPYELNTAINCRDEIVSPVLKGAEHGGGGGGRHRKRRRTCSKSESAKVHAEDERREGEGKKVTPEKAKGGGGGKAKMAPSFPSKQRRFQYGNYSKYYGYRNPGRCDDPRLDVLKPGWFQGKDILDLGCNSGHLTLSIAKDLKPSRIVGVDIDGGLVHSARQNIRHFLSEDVLPSRPQHAHFPVSLAKCKGPIAAPAVAVALDRRLLDFPNNVTFVQGNYVLEKDELLETQRPEYDVILCLSLTKWIHLNWGDEGLKRMFKRIYRHLRPGGIFILEPQPWSSYGKRRKLTETIYRNYYRIILKPEQFTSYLLSPEVGFSSYELVGTPQSTSKGFQRPVYLFHKNRRPTAS
ncbi:7SK snRNA methylphosphate capping enzyme-like isoform X2 [Rhinoraja longicauda]